ncbi:hypothetical protein ABRQ22_17340 [Cellulosimicrobium sp. ES-005]|uniref:Uncharacterized protein n=1 Tax=Cellulosimicrobium sp. ES-005 TaxID=3163031 RepID=A0AAU8FZ83_9MICO
MSWTPTDEQVEKAAEEVARAATEFYSDAAVPHYSRHIARAVLVAVGPHIAATERKRITAALRQKFGVTNRAADWIDRVFWGPDERADQIEKETDR